ncbi:BA75_05254T0 [Komagataella pastoris]|uniref:BA75_05254T0 n=1 Tax=Komagataella pastoris TaxID=4922 RepID=A0A1B2JIQ9_PICPA|nr:BA75_05254T0 [Komagataella pastoris]
MLAENEDYCRTNSSKGSSYNCYNKELLSEDLLEANPFASPIDDLVFHPMPSPPINVDSEQPQESQLKHNNQCSCLQELKTKPVDQQELYLLPNMLTKNIFNSQPSMLVYSYIPQISSVQSFIGKNTSFLANDTALEGKSLFVDSTIGISFDQSVQDLYSYGLNCADATPSPECPSGNLNLLGSMEACTNSLEAAVNSKRRMFQLRKQNIIEGVNYSDDIADSKLTFLNHSWVPLVRGRNFGGSSCRPPKKPLLPGTRYVTARLRLEYSNCEDMCLPEWNEHELEDSRRIIRIERRYDSSEIVASFSIVGSAVENPETRPVSNPNVRVLEVSCLRCLTNDKESEGEQYVDENAADEEHHCVTEPQKPSFGKDLDGRTHKISRISAGCKYFITSVEVIKIIELLVGSFSISDPQQRRKERGRVRSNLAQFWSKYLVSSSKKNMRRRSLPACNDEYLAELAHRINTYEIRKPRIFDKSIKILEWPRLGPALQRAFQSYYMVQLDESYNQIVLTNND